MNNQSQDRRFSFKDVFPAKTETCKRESELLEYFEQVLPEENMEDFVQHLAGCAICAGHLSALEETKLEAEFTSIDAGKADLIFQKNRTRLKEHLERKYGPLPEKRSGILPFSGFRIPSYAGALMAGLILLLIYPAYKGFILDEQVIRLQNELKQERTNQSRGSEDVAALKQNYEKQLQNLTQERDKLLQPSVSISEIRSVRTERSDSVAAINVRFASPDENRNLVFSVPAGYQAYLVEIFRDNNSVWKNEITVVPDQNSEFALISVNLPATYFQKGTYMLKIAGTNKAVSEPLGEFKLKIQ
jgi:hypothetical protein